MRIAVLDKSRCRPDICGLLCQRMCPRVRSGDETIVVDELDKKPIIVEELCVGCGICVNKCPFDAIIITNTPEETGTLTNQYGKNGFRLYGLPVPRSGSVVGILGVNGIGKSTAVKILSGQLKPNLGRLGEDLAWGDIIESYRGSEVQTYLQDLASGKAKAVYKPQYVDALSKIGGTVKNALSKASNNYTEIAETMELSPLLSRKVKDLSGGELQRLAIAIALLRDVDLYFFDEPSSFLDISQRLKMARTLRKVAESGKSVIAVEHDLIVLDYLSDHIHIAYGQKSAFGILSQLKGTRVGINEYLSGKLRSENVRIRPSAIEYEVTGSKKFKSEDLLCEYPEIVKNYEGFKLNAEKGAIYRGSVVGILGPNATGKTTFMRIIVGEEKNDGEEISLGLKISYKPQYLTPIKKTVREVLQSVTQDLYKSHYKTSILEPLELEPLLDHNADELSGGELQRLAIAECLSRDADIYFLDEPSAYLDVEQRLMAAKIIRKKMENEKKSAVVIDHDIGFVDYISDNIMVFSGIPGESGSAAKPMDMREGMNQFLAGMDISFRRDEETKRPRANKPLSQRDKEQRNRGEYYYA
jgi:ATP-binding cassette, sub-family E, member 1